MCLCTNKHASITSASALYNPRNQLFIPCRIKYSFIVGRNTRGERISRPSWWVSFLVQRGWTPPQHLERMWKTLLVNVSFNMWRITEWRHVREIWLKDLASLNDSVMQGFVGLFVAAGCLGFFGYVLFGCLSFFFLSLFGWGCFLFCCCLEIFFLYHRLQTFLKVEFTEVCLQLAGGALLRVLNKSQTI